MGAPSIRRPTGSYHRRGRDWINSDTNWPSAPPVGGQLQLQRQRDAIVSLTVGEFHLERYATRRMHQPYTGVKCTLSDSAPMAYVFNNRLMVPVSSGNYKFRENVSLVGALCVHLSSHFSTGFSLRIIDDTYDEVIRRATFTFVIKFCEERGEAACVWTTNSIIG